MLSSLQEDPWLPCLRDAMSLGDTEASPRRQHRERAQLPIVSNATKQRQQQMHVDRQTRDVLPGLPAAPADSASSASSACDICIPMHASVCRN